MMDERTVERLNLLEKSALRDKAARGDGTSNCLTEKLCLKRRKKKVERIEQMRLLNTQLSEEHMRVRGLRRVLLRPLSRTVRELT